MDQEERSGFLPPEPPGPEPELGSRPAPQPPPGPQAPPPQPPAYGQQQQQAYAPPPGYPQQQQPPPGAWYPAPQQVWSYPQQQVPDNNQAIAGFILSLVAGGLLLISVGLSSIISVGCAIAGMLLGRRGVRRVDAGETPKHRSLGQAGFWIGLVSLILSLIATAGWIAVLVAALSDEDFRDDLERELDGSQTLSVVAAAAARLALNLLA